MKSRYMSDNQLSSLGRAVLMIVIIALIMGAAATAVILVRKSKIAEPKTMIEMSEEIAQLKSNSKYQEALDYALKQKMFVFWKTEGGRNLYVDTKYRTAYFSTGYATIPRMLPDGSVETFDGDWLEIDEIYKTVKKYLKV